MSVKRAVLSELSDNQLVSATINGDERAFAELFLRWRSRLTGYVTHIIGDSERAEDLVQEAFLRIAKHLRRFDQNKKFSTWAYTICHNLSKNELRNRIRSPLVFFNKLESQWSREASRPIEFTDHKPGPYEMYRRRYLRQMVERTVAQLSAPHRQVFVLRELEGRTYEEIAEIVGVNLGTVKSRLNRARTHFAELIEPHLN